MEKYVLIIMLNNDRCPLQESCIFTIFLCVNTNSFEIFSQFNVLCLQFSACDYEKGIAARRIHRKVSEFVINSFAFS